MPHFTFDNARLKFCRAAIKVFARLFLKRRCRPPTAVVALRRARNLYIGVFFLIAFSFAPASAKEKANGDLIFPLAVDGTWGHGRGEHCSPAKKHKITFPLSYFCVTKSTKSHLRGLSSLLKNTFRVHELVVQAMRGKCVRQRIKQKLVVLPLPTISAIPRVRTYHTRKPSRFVHALSARPHI